MLDIESNLDRELHLQDSDEDDIIVFVEGVGLVKIKIDSLAVADISSPIAA